MAVLVATAARWPGGGTAARARPPAARGPRRVVAEPEQKAATVRFVKCRLLSWTKPIRHDVRAQMSNVNVGAGNYGEGEANSHGERLDTSSTGDPNKLAKQLSGSRYLQSIGAVLLLCALATSFFVFFKGQPSAVVAMLAKSGFTAAFALIFVSEIGDKTFFIAALLAMQYQRALVLLGSMAALSLMTIVSVIIGRIFQSVPAQFQTTLPIGEYAAVALLAFFGFKSIKDALELPDNASGNLQGNSESGELAEAEELVKEKVSKKLTSPLEVLWKSFSLVFFAEWGDRSMLATIALGAAQSPLGVTSGAIAGHLIATVLAILGGAFLANYLSEKLEMRPPKPVHGRLKSFTLHTTQEDINIDISDITDVPPTLPPQPVHQQPPHCPGPLAHPRSQEDDDDDDDFMQPPTRHPVTNNKQRRTTNVVVNARRCEKKQKKIAPRTAPPGKPKQQKVTKYLHAATARCAPSIFNSFIDLLTMRQRIIIQNMKFGGLLQIRADKLFSREMLKYLYDRLDPEIMVMDLGKDRVIHINPFAVKQVFGIPDSGEELSLHTNQEACKALSNFKDSIGLQEDENVQTKYLQEIWGTDIEQDSRMLDDDMCIKIFFMIASNKLLFPSSDNNIRAKDVYLARNLSRLPTMNWCKAVTDEIQDAARTWRLDRTPKVSPSITGCAIFLLIVYLDNLRCTHQINHKDIPRAKYFTQDVIKKIIAADKKKDDQGKVTFGRLPLRDINDTCYYTPD